MQFFAVLCICHLFIEAVGCSVQLLAVQFSFKLHCAVVGSRCAEQSTFAVHLLGLMHKDVCGRSMNIQHERGIVCTAIH